MGGAVPEHVAPATGGRPVEPVIWPIPVIIRVVSATWDDAAIARIVVVARRAGVLGGRGLCSRRWRAAKHDRRSVLSGCRLSVGGIRTADHDCCRDGATRIGLSIGRLGSGQCSRSQADTAYQDYSSDQPFAAVHRSLLGAALRLKLSPTATWGAKNLQRSANLPNGSRCRRPVRLLRHLHPLAAVDPSPT